MTTRWKAGASLRILKGLGDFVIVLAGWGRRLNWSNESERIFFCAMIVFVAAAFYDYRGVGGGCVAFLGNLGRGEGLWSYGLDIGGFFFGDGRTGGRVGRKEEEEWVWKDAIYGSRAGGYDRGSRPVRPISLAKSIRR